MLLKMRLVNWIYKNLSADPKETAGGASPPGDWLRYEFGEMDDGKPMFIANTTNDGFDVGLAYGDGGKWLVFFKAATARDLAKWILWNWWAKATWFGLKQKIWYWALLETIKDQKLRWAKRH